ncbi:metallophosphatase [Pseudoalteromonas distincta]|uniref:Metallophosphoesterase n=1 Tax=Pseudoalteromonas distincta TaxID=77608 RepID=A0ABT9GI01_9GAMM|nr:MULTISPECIES: metallophosphoesterase [Pseudoalteromonas distincta group]KHM44454.1 metallophosphatase [Pseudoalteromonas elyakovii]KID39771.1 metallophosphatase [Pseudoalteromonas distincta]MDP4485492.1 metallophosphoesterase [Pseudoalteromonas elyakovii]
MQSLTISRVIIFIFLSFILTACGSGDEVTVNPNDPVEPEPSKLTLSSANGLDATLDEGNFIFNAPSSAISSDVELTYEKTLLDETNIQQNIISDLHALTPSTLTLEKPITITIKIPDDYALGGQLFIAKLSGANWDTVTNSIVLDRFVSAQVTTLGTYAIQMQRNEAFANIGPTCDANATEQSVRFVHVADLHARFGYEEQYFSRIKAYYNQVASQTPHTLFTNGGDDYEKGTVAEQLSQGTATEEAIKAMQFDLRVVGNHDYAWGPEKLLSYSQDENAIVLASNTRYEAEQRQDFAGVGFAKVQVGCITLGVFGMTSVPWNELDEPIQDDPIPDFIKQFKMSWQWQQIAQSIVNQYSDDVDYMIMLSHLGVGQDTDMATNVPGIDLVLGGHTHGGESYTTLDNGAIVLQPDFYAKGITDLTLNFNLADKSSPVVDYKTIETDTIDERDETTKLAIDEIMGRYAPDAETEIAISENYPTDAQLAEITALAAKHSSTINAALLNPELVQKRWTPGTLTQEDFHKAFYVERQPSNTPGFNSIYKVTVSGSDLTTMFASQPDWFLLKPEDIQPTNNYEVALFKGAALNPDLFFNSVTFSNVEPIAEAWWLLDKYARARTSQCLHLDTDTELYSCNNLANVTVWNFDDTNNPLAADFGPSVLSYFDPDETNWGTAETQYSTTTQLNIDDLSDGPSGVMAFSRHAPTEGLLIDLNTPANGDFANEGMVSDYTLVMDLYWPAEGKDIYRAIMQANTTDYLNDDADMFIDPSGGYGQATSDSGYFGNTQPDSWHRIAFVFYTAPTNGVFEVYIDGELAGVKEDGEIDSRWALNQSVLLFTDNNYETVPGYLNSLLYAGRAMTRDEIKSMGGAQQKLSFEQPTRVLNQTIERHYQAAPAIKTNVWIEQRNKFFGNGS